MTRQKQISIVATNFHRKEVELMLAESRRVCEEKGLEVANALWVPGALETPLALLRELSAADIDGAIVLGIIERGETKHGLVMGMAVISAIVDIQLKLGKPIGVAILGPEVLPEQIPLRLHPYAKDAALAVWEMLNS